MVLGRCTFDVILIVIAHGYVATYEQGEVFICGKKRQGLVSDEDISGLRIGLVYFLIVSVHSWNGIA